MVKYSNAAFALVALFAALSMGPTPANGLSHMEPVVRRHHPIGSDKMVRKIKRQGGGGILPIGGGGSNTGTTSGTDAATNTDTATAKPSDTKKASDTPKPSDTSDTSKSTNTPNTNTASTDTATKGTTSNTPATNTPTTNPATNTPVNTPPPAAANTGTPTTKKNNPTVFVTATDTGAAASDTADQQTSSAFSARTWIILGSIVGGIIVIAALWTVIRKWKFSPSKKFEDRLEPIDWQPENATGAAAGAGASGAALARTNSLGSQRSGPTADEYHNRHMYAPNAAPEYPPEMYGGAAYADMHRGGTPQPQMDQLGHGPVYARGPYDGYDNGPAPYHQPQHAQDPYGGYAEQEYGAPAGPYRGY